MGAGKVPWSKGWLQGKRAMQVCSPDGQGWPTSAVPGLTPWAGVGHHLRGLTYSEVPIPWASGGCGMLSFVLWASVPPLARSKWSLLLTSLGYEKVPRRSSLSTVLCLGSPVG